MNMMRRIKSIASGRTSVSSDIGGDIGIKRAKVDQETEQKVDGVSGDVGRVVSGLEPNLVSTSLDNAANTSNISSTTGAESNIPPTAGAEKSNIPSTAGAEKSNIPSTAGAEKSNVSSTAGAEKSNISSTARAEKSGFDHLPKEMREMRIRDEKSNHNEKDLEPAIVKGNGTEAGQIIATHVGGQNGKPKQTISYMAERVVGTGSFGVVFQAKCLETNEAVAIKKVLQDKRYKNRELQIMRTLDHPNIVQLKHCFFSTTDKDELYLNLVLEYISETVYKVSKHYFRMNRSMPIIYVQLYTYQICRALNYLHNVVGVCHRDIKPQNLLVNPQTHQLKICDFGSAKMLVPGEPNISYICSRYYRAPELIFGATEYTNAIDMWSVGCVMAEFLLGQPLFPGESGVDQLVEIIKILGTPTREEIKCMNPNYTEFKFPQIKAHPWHKIFRTKMPAEAIDLVSRLLQYSPNLRCTVLEACAHPFFDDLRDPNACLPNGQPLPPLFNFTAQELAGASTELRHRLVPEHARN